MLWGMAEAIFCQCPIYYESLTLTIPSVNLMLDLPTPTLQTSHLRVCITYEAGGSIQLWSKQTATRTTV